MSYRDAYHPKIKSDLKKLDRSVAKEIHDIHLDTILHNPSAGESLYGDPEEVLSYHFRKNKTDYRIAYTIDTEKRIVHFIMIAKRENFYEILKRRFT